MTEKTDNKKSLNLATHKAIEKHFGKVVSLGTELVASKQKLESITVSPALDIALNGGLLEGSWTVISGDPKAGKTSLSLQVCKNAQDVGRPIVYVDGESRLKAYNLLGVEGIDISKFQVIHSPEDGEPLSAEDYLKICESMIKMPENKGAVCVIDSCSSLVPRDELDRDASATIRASLPKLLSHWIKKNAQTVVNNKIIVLIITHYITNTSGYGKIKIPDCGVMVQYQADTRMDVSKVEPWIEDGKKIGQIVHWNIACSSMGASGTSCISYLKFGKGIDKSKEIIELAESFGIIDKGGAWYTLSFLEGTEEFGDKPPKFQGQAKLYEFLESRKDIFDIVNSKVKDFLA